VSLILLSLGALIPFPEPASAYTPHAPILIIGDANFLPANGVTGGSGTWNDPYVIEGWDINASTAHGIEIRNTNAYFVVRDVYVHSGRLGLRDGLRLFGVANGQARNSTLDGNDDGVKIIGGSNVTLDTLTLSNNQGSGIDVSGTDGLSIGSSRLLSNTNGIDGFFVTGVRINATEVGGSLWSGVLLSYAQNTTITASMFTNNSGTGVVLYRSDNASISSSLVAWNTAGGIRLNATTNVTVGSTDFLEDGLTIVGTSLDELNSHTIAADNRVNGLPLRYYKDASSLALDGLATGQLIVVNATDVTATNLTIAGADTAISMSYVDRAEVASNTISGNVATGVFLSHVNGLAVIANTVEDNGAGGVVISDATDVDVSGNTFSRNGAGGLGFTATTNASVASNVFRNNLGFAASLVDSSNVTLNGNSFIDYSGALKTVDDRGAENAWDGGYPAGGNFWSSYSGPDAFGGPLQDQPGADGIGDAPFVIDPDSRDRYPLIATVAGDTTPPSVAITAPAEQPPVATSPVPVSGTATDNVGVALVQVRVNGGAWVNASGTSSWSVPVVLSAGPNLVEARAWDLAGNPSAVDSVTVTYDATAPSLLLGSPQDGSVVSGATVLVSGTTEPGTTLTVNGLVAAVAPDGSFSFRIALIEGENVITATARDPAGNSATLTSSVTYAPPAPDEFGWVFPAFLTAFFAALLALVALIGFGHRHPEGEAGQDPPAGPASFEAGPPSFPPPPP